MHISIRRFYTDQVAEAPAAPVDVAALMAKQGKMIEAESSDAVPDIIIEEQKKPAEPAPEIKAETADPEPKPAADPTPPAPSQPAAPIQAPAADWRDELKKADHSEILKELGFDPKMVGFFNKWRTDGNITEYLKAATTDYTKMTPEQLMRFQMLEDHPELSADDFEELYRARVIEQYKLDPAENSEAEVKRGRILINADAKAVREKLIARQQDYILNAKPPAPQPKEDTEAQAKQQAEIDKVLTQYKDTLEAHAATKELRGNKRLVIGEGTDTFNFEVADPAKAINALQHPEQWAQLVFKQDGTPDVEKQLFLATAAVDHKLLSAEIFKAGKALGAKQALEQIENAKKPDAVAAKAEEPMTPAQALAKAGVITPG